MKVKSWHSVWGDKARVNVKSGKLKLWSSSSSSAPGWIEDAEPELIVKGKLKDPIDLKLIILDVSQ